MSKENISIVIEHLINDDFAKKVGRVFLVCANNTKSKQNYGFYCEDYIYSLSEYFCATNIAPEEVASSWRKLNDAERGNLVSFMVEQESEKELVVNYV